MNAELKETSRETIREAKFQFGDGKDRYEIVLHHTSGEIINALKRFVDEHAVLRAIEQRVEDVEGVAEEMRYHFPGDLPMELGRKLARAVRDYLKGEG